MGQKLAQLRDRGALRALLRRGSRDVGPLVGVLMLLFCVCGQAQPAKAAVHPAAQQAHVLALAETPLAGHIIGPNFQAHPVDVTHVVQLQHGEALFARTSTIATKDTVHAALRPGAQRWLLPYQYHFFDTQGQQHSSHLVAEVAGGGLWATDAGDLPFTGLLYVMLEDSADPTLTYPLPVPAQVLVTAPINQVLPDTIALTTTNHWAGVAMKASAPPSHFGATLRASTDSQGLVVDIPVNRQPLSVEPSADSIAGFGLDAAKLTIRATGLLHPAGRIVTVAAIPGKLTDSSVTLNDQGIGETELRSVGLGTATVRATMPLLADAPAKTISFAFPWAFLVSALLGGCCGGLLRRYQTKEPTSRPSVPVAIAMGCIAGLVGATLSAVGINLLPIKVPQYGGEALVFGVAALFAIVGVTLGAQRVAK